MKHLKTKTVYISFFLLFCLTGCSQKNSSATSLDIPDTTIETSDSDPFEPLTVHFLDVGQGDCTIITQGQHTMLIDAGQNHHGTKIQHYLNELGIDTLDYAILTHPDADHIGSADVILYKFDCEKIMMPDMKADTQTYEEVIQTLKEKNYTRPFWSFRFLLSSFQY